MGTIIDISKYDSCLTAIFNNRIMWFNRDNEYNYIKYMPLNQYRQKEIRKDIEMIDRKFYIHVKNKKEHEWINNYLKSCGEEISNLGEYPIGYYTRLPNEYVYVYYIIDYWSWCYSIKPINQINASKLIRQKKLERILK